MTEETLARALGGLRVARMSDAAAHRVRLDVLPGLRMAAEVVHRHVRTRSACLVDRRVARDAEQERYKRHSAILVPVQSYHRAQEHFGYQILRLVFRACPRQAIAKDRIAIALVELSKRGSVTGLGGLDERRVDTALRHGSCRLAGGSGVRDDLRAPGHLWSQRR